MEDALLSEELLPELLLVSVSAFAAAFAASAAATLAASAACFPFNKKGKLTKSSKLNIIPCSISSSSGYNDYCPVPLTGDAKQRVLDKISQYSEGL